MMKYLLYFLLGYSFSLHAQSLYSPDSLLTMRFELIQGQPTYQLSWRNKEIVRQSSLGLKTKNENLTGGFKIIRRAHNTFDQTWEPVLGEYRQIRDHYNQWVVSLLQEQTGIEMRLIFRLYNDGLAFRYSLPLQQHLQYFELTDELTQFQLAGDHTAFWIKSDFDSQEYPYQQTRLSEIDVSRIPTHSEVAVQSVSGNTNVQSPLLMKSTDGLYIHIFEAAVDNYPVMHLQVDTGRFLLTSLLTPNAIGSKAFLRTPFHSPWRTVIVSDDARKILSANTLILNLNEPSRLQNTSWIKPMKYVGIWWEMHVGKSTWDYAGNQSGQSYFEMKPTGRHGATTENTRRYIDFAARHGFDGVLVEGWNVGWEDWFGKWKEDVFDFVTPYPDFDIAALSEYAKSKGIQMIMHHETSGSAANYERWLDRSMEVMKKYGYPAVKTGYVGKIIPRGEHHDGQTMVNHFHHIVRRMADYQLMVNSHESSRPTGMHRTYPNYIAAEAARGNEFNAWSEGNPPMHETILPFTRLMGGPMDYTPGIFQIKMDAYTPGSKHQVHTTLAKQLALYVTMYSPLQMAADLPENYEKYPDAFQFVKDVALDWDDTRILEAEPGDYLTIARKAKGREEWFIGAITDENARLSMVALDFLPPGVAYEVIMYEDGPGADWQDNPQSYAIHKTIVHSRDELPLLLAPGGGAAWHLRRM